MILTINLFLPKNTMQLIATKFTKSGREQVVQFATDNTALINLVNSG